MVAKGVQDLLICTEMLMAAICFQFTFPVSDFVPLGEAMYVKQAQGEGGPGVSSSGAMTGEGHGGAGETVSIWTALYTSCIPLELRQEFTMAAMQCREDDACLPFCWPCRCRIKCGGAHPRSPRRSKGVGRTPSNAGVRSGGGGSGGGQQVASLARRSF